MAAAACLCGVEVAAHDQLEIQIIGSPESSYDSEIPRLNIPITRDATAFDFDWLNGFWSTGNSRWNNRWHNLKVILPYGLTNLTTLNLSSSRIHSLFLPNDLTNLRTLAISDLSNFSREASQDFRLPEGLASLESLSLRGNNLNRFTLSKDFTRLKTLDLYQNGLTSFILPEGFSELGNDQSR